MKFVHGHKLEFHATMDMNQIIHAMLNGLPTFFMAEKNSNKMNLSFTSRNFTMEQTHIESSFGKNFVLRRF